MLFCVHGKFIRPAYSLQGVILILLLSRYLHARIILFRPILADLYLRPQCAKDVSASRLHMRCSTCCSITLTWTR